jgi:hypothetical protein
LSRDFSDRHKADHRFTTFYDPGTFRRYLKSQLYVRALRAMHHAPYQRDRIQVINGTDCEGRFDGQVLF